MLTVRFARVGKNKRAQFKIVLQEHTIAPGGRHVEILGSYDPHVKKAVLKEERIKYWISEGVQFSDTAYNLMVVNGLISGEKRKVKLPAKQKEGGKEGEVSAEDSKAKEEKPADENKKEVKADKKEEASKELARNASLSDADRERPAEEKKEETKA